MYYLIGKMIQEFLWPLTWGLLGLLAAFVASYRERHRTSRALMAFSFVVVFLPSTPMVSDMLSGYLEGAYPNRRISDYELADAIVVLSGSTAKVAANRYEAEEVAGSRLLPAARLFRAGKAKLVIVTGGNAYSGVDGKPRSDADDMRDLLLDFGVPAEAIVLEPKARTTRENALYTHAIIQSRGIKSILLVTSAFHMRRAVALFQLPELKVIPVPTGHEVGPRVGLLSRIPSASMLERSTRAIKEYVGYLAAVIPLLRP